MKKTNVLIFPSGSENAIEIYESLKDHIDIEVFGATTKPDHTQFLYSPNKYCIGEFSIHNDNFLKNFNHLIKKWKIDIVIPTHDSVAYFLSKHQNKIITKVLTADESTCLICREKRFTFDFFNDCSFCPKIFKTIAEVKDKDYPIFAKPNIGEGGKYTKLLNNSDDLRFLMNEKDFVFCEYLPGDEYTIDCFTNSSGNLIFSGCRKRERIEMGISFRAQTIKMTETILDIAKTINSRLKFFGGWFFQIKQDYQGNWKLLEISCRHAGTMTLYRHKGINFALMGIYELNGIEVTALELPGTWSVDRCLNQRFKLPYSFETIYVDLDDTIIVKNNVHTTMISFLYKCLNQGKEIILITRHTKDPLVTLKNYKISHLIFSRIIHLKSTQSKADFISNCKNAIFIDNSFSERLEIFNRLGVPSFDINSITALV